MNPATIRLTIDLEDNLCTEGFPRVDFASLIEPPSIPTPATTAEISSAGGSESLPPKEQEGKGKKHPCQPNLHSGKTYKGIREQDFYEVAHGYDTDDPFVDDSEAYEDFAPSETKLEHGSFYVNKGKVEFSQIPFENPEGSIIFEDTPPPNTKGSKSAITDTSMDGESGSPIGMKRSSSFVGNESYVITPPKKMSKKRKDSIKFSPKMVLKRTKSFKDNPTESTADSPLLDKSNASSLSDKPTSSPTDATERPNQPVFIEKTVSKNLFPPQAKTVEFEKPKKTLTKPTPPQTSPQSVPSKKSEKTAHTVVPAEPMIDINTILLTKLLDSNVLVQMDLTTDCFTPGFYEKNNIHTFSSQIPDSLANIIQLFFNHIQSMLKSPSNRNSQENRFARCLVLAKIHAFMKRKQDLNLTESIQNFLAPFFLNKSHSLTVILDTILTIIQNAFISPPLQALISQIQPHIDRIHESNSAESSQDEKQTASKKRFKWSFELKKLLGNSVTAQIEIEKNGFGICPEKLTNEQIILQFLGSCVIPCWPKGRMKATKLYKVTLPYHQDFTSPPALTSESTLPMPIPTSSSPSISSSTKIGNWKLHYTEQYAKPVAISGQQKTNESRTETSIHRPAPVKIMPPSNRTPSPKSKLAHTMQLNRELIPVTPLMPLDSLSMKKSPLLKKNVEIAKPREKSPNPLLVKSDTNSINSIGFNKSPIHVSKSQIQTNKSPIPYQSEADVKPMLPASFNTHISPMQLELLQSVRSNNMLPDGRSLYPANYINSLQHSTEAALINQPFNLLNASNFAQNIALIQAYPETIIHLKPGSNETSHKNSKSQSQP